MKSPTRQFEENDRLDTATGLPWGRDARANETAYTVALFTNLLKPLGEPLTKLLLCDLVSRVAGEFLGVYGCGPSPYNASHLCRHVAAGGGMLALRAGSNKVIVITERPGKGGHYAKRLHWLFNKWAKAQHSGAGLVYTEFTEAPDLVKQELTTYSGVWRYDTGPDGEPLPESFRYAHRL